MKTATTAFKAAQKSPGAFSVRRLSYKRRYWVEASKSYAWEGSWTVLPESEVVSVSPITAKLDTDRLNEFKISNVNLVLKNERRQWKADCRTGYFGPTGASIFGFEPYWTKFKIESGYEVAGVATYITLFVGVVVEFNTAGYSDTVQVSVQGQEALLMNANAEDVATTVTNENMGTGNASNKDFTTAQPGVGIIVEVSLDGIKKKAGTDYTVSQTDTPTLGAKVSFTVAPGVGVVVRSTYKYWKQDQKIEEVVGDLLTAAGIGGPSRDIQSVLFPAGIIQNITIDSQGDWNAGTKTAADVSRTPGDLEIDFGDSSNKTLLDNFNSTLDPAWSIYNAASIVSSKLQMGGASACAAYRPSAKAYGYWEVKIKNISSPSIASYFYFMGGSVSLSGSDCRLNSGYSVALLNGTIFLLRDAFVLDAVAATVTTGTEYTIGIGRNPNGAIRVWMDGVLKISANDNTYTSSDKLMLSVGQSTGWSFDDLYVPSDTAVASWTSASFDCSAAPSAWGILSKAQTLTGSASSTFLTQTSTDGVSWDAFVAVNAYGQIGSALKRYLRVRIDLSSSAPPANWISVQSATIPFTSASTRIKMPSFAGKTVYQAMQSLGSFANYEWGFREDEVFFFRSKNVDPAVDEVLDTSINVAEITTVTDGVDRVYSEVQATYGDFDVTVSDDGKTKDGPVSRYGKRRLTIDGGDVLLAPDTDIASGVALSFYSSVSKPKRQFRVRAKLMEWLDLSDTVSLICSDNVPVRPWHIGDQTVYLGQLDIYFFGDAEQTARNVPCKVVGYRHDTEAKLSEFDLEEIPT